MRDELVRKMMEEGRKGDDGISGISDDGRKRSNEGLSNSRLPTQMQMQMIIET